LIQFLGHFVVNRDSFLDNHFKDFNKINHLRRVFSRFEKLGDRYLAFLYFIGTLFWLR